MEYTVLALAVVALGASGLALFWASRARRLAESLRPDPGTLLALWRELEPAEAAGELGAFLETVRQRLQGLERHTQELERHGRLAYTRSGLLRFDTDSEIKGQLSFSLALLNERGDGFLLTSLYNLDSSRIFLRPVQAGQAQHELLPEEAEALRQARGESG